MADFFCKKRAASSESSSRGKYRRTDDSEVLPRLVAGFGKDRNEFIRTMHVICNLLQRQHFGVWAKECRWQLKRDLYQMLPVILAELNQHWLDHSDHYGGLKPGKQPVRKYDVHCAEAFLLMLDRLVQSGYAQTPMDRYALVNMQVHLPGLAFLVKDGDVLFIVVKKFYPWTDEFSSRELDKPVDDMRSLSSYSRLQALQVQLYVYLAEHDAFHDQWGRTPNDPSSRFWDPLAFRVVLQHMPMIFLRMHEDLQADEWEMYSSDLEGPLRTIVSYLAPHGEPLRGHMPIAELIEFLIELVKVLDKYESRFGAKISSKSRAAPLEELIRVCGVLVTRIMQSDDNCKVIKDWAVLMLKLLFNMLLLEVPTCQRNDHMRDGRGDFPSDERQQDPEWIELLCERIHGFVQHTFDPQKHMKLVLERMVSMPVSEQRYRFECITPLLPTFVGQFTDQLKAHSELPSELSSLKAVFNTVMQDDASAASELLEEPPMSEIARFLDFATKRSLIRHLCERTKMQSKSDDPIRLVVPRNNVLDGVCSTLNLQDANARIEVPLEIEFRSGYADDTGAELADEGEDQGGLRRQWLDRASRHFIASDLFISPSEDAAHLEAQPNEKSSSSRTTRGAGLIFVPAPEPVCQHIQEDWKEQFELFGCILGFTILYKETIPVHFGHAFLQSVFGIKTPAEDLLPLLEDIDKTLHTKLKYILEGTYQNLGDSLEEVLEQCHLPRNFTLSESRCPDLVKNTELKPGGESILVTEDNKEEFVKLVLERFLIKGIASQVECFRRGLLRTIPEELVNRITELMTVKEIELMVCGTDTVDVLDWQKNTNYENGYTETSQPVVWFWEAVTKMTDLQRAALLSFSTGASQVPSGGFRFLQPEMFCIQRVAVTDRYPEAHTCANMVDLPEYTSCEELEKRLLFAIEEAGDSFGRR